MPQSQFNRFLLIISIFTIVTVSHTFAQNWIFGRGSNSAYNMDAWCVKTDTFGNIFGAGMRVTPGSGPTAFGTVVLPFLSGMYPCEWVKYDPSGTPLWAGGTQGDTWLYDIATDRTGDLIVFGAFTSDSVQIGTLTLHNSYGSTGSGQYFLAKINPLGSVVWAVNDGNAATGGLDYTSNMYLMKLGSVCTDNSGNIYITSSFTKPSITIGSFTLSNSYATGYVDNIFVAKYSPVGSVVWATATGDSTMGHGFGITATPNGNIYITGDFSSPSLTVGSVVITNPYYNNAMHSYVLAFSSTGTPLWGQGFGGSGYNGNAMATGIASDTEGNVYVTGAFEDTSIMFGSLTLTRTYPSTVPSRDLYLVKYSSTGTAVWAKTIGSLHPSTCCGNGTLGYGVATAQCGRVWVTGRLVSDVSIDGNILSPPIGSLEPLFIAGYNTAGTSIGAACLSSGSDDQFDVTCDAFGNVFVVADYEDTAMVIGPDSLANAGGGESFYLAKFTPSHDTAYSSTDTSVCALSESFSLNAPSGFFNWSWSNGSTSQSTTINTTGTYIVYASGYCADLIDTFHVSLRSENDCINLVSPLTLKQPSIFPNPAHNELTVCDAATNTAIIYDISGRELKQYYIKNNRETLDVSNLAKGSYIIHFCNENGNKTNVLFLQE